MNYENAMQYAALVISGLLGWVVRTLDKRMDSMEAELKDKLDKEQYVEDQRRIGQDISAIREKLFELPHQIVSLIKDTK